MRDHRFIAEHRGGPLKKEHQRQLMEWACHCSQHVLPLYDEVTDERLIVALEVAKAWQEGKATVGQAMKASVNAHAAAREASSPVAVAVARSVGQVVATAHMADHSMGAAWYALKAVKSAGKSAEEEREWQNRKMPPEVAEMLLNARDLRRV